MSSKPKPVTKEIKLVASTEPKLGRVYANFVQVGLSPYDMTLRFCDAPPGSDIKGNKKELIIPTQCEIVIPVEVAGSLAALLKATCEKFYEAYDQAQDSEDFGDLTDLKKESTEG